MSADYTVDELIAQIKLKAYVPDNSSESVSDTDILRFMNYEQTYFVVPKIMSIREEYFVASSDTTIGTTSTFDIPLRAIGNKLRDVLRVDQSGNQFSIARIEPEDVPRFNINNNYIRGFYIENNKIKVLGNQSSSDVLRLKYFRRPSNLVAKANCGLITAINTGTNTITINNMTTAFTTSSVVDLINGHPFFESLADSITPSTVTVGGSTTDLVFSSALPSGLAAGDWVCPSGDTCVPQLPLEAFPLLAERTVMKIMQALNDKEGYMIAKTEAEECKELLLEVMTDRVEGEDRKVINTNNFAWRNRRFWIY